MSQERETPAEPSKRYAVQFTPVGWFVIDTQVARDPVAQFGLGDDEYRRAKAEAGVWNSADQEACANA